MLCNAGSSAGLLCDDQMDGMGVGVGGGVPEGGGVCIHMADSLCCSAEANTTL